MARMSAQGTVVRDAPERSRYELVIGERVVGFADYSLDGQVITVPHVEVEPAARGGSLGSVLVRQMLDDVRHRGLSIRPLCPFVRVYIRGHEEYADLVAAS
jgi:predicted GNAT family acetyltransferase